MIRNAVILARGLGTRMRRPDGSPRLSEAQIAAAATGVKALVSVGRPFLDYSLAALADVGIRDVCLVIGPEHAAVRDHCRGLGTQKLSIDFAVQEEPRGTADAVGAASEAVGDAPFLVLNSDNYYPRSALRSLVELNAPGVVGFTPEGLSRGNIAPSRIAQFSVMVTDNGYLRRIIEKPTPEELAELEHDVLVNMNCWAFDRRILDACAAIGPSARGEWELTSAVQHAIDSNQCRWQVVRCDKPVLDMTSRADIASVQAALAGIEVRL